MRSRIMYIESKGERLQGPARIGRVTFTKSGKGIYYKDRAFYRISGFKANYADAESHEPYWISGPRRDGRDRLYCPSGLLSKSMMTFGKSIGPKSGESQHTPLAQRNDRRDRLQPPIDSADGRLENKRFSSPDSLP
jgi:hypothetical protein